MKKSLYHLVNFIAITVLIPHFFLSGSKLTEFELTEDKRYEEIHNKLITFHETQLLKKGRFLVEKAKIEENISNLFDLPEDTHPWVKTQMIAFINDSIENFLEGNFNGSEVLYAGIEPWEQVFEFPIEGQLFSDSTEVKNVFQMGWRKQHPTLKTGKWHYGIDISIASDEGIIIASTDLVIRNFYHNNDAGYVLEWSPVGHPEDIFRDLHCLGRHKNSKGKSYPDSLWKKLVIGDTIFAGENLVTVGQSGQRCTGRHRHLEYEKDGMRVNMALMYNWETLEPVADSFVLRKAKDKPWYDAIPVYKYKFEDELPENDMAMRHKTYMSSS